MADARADARFTGAPFGAAALLAAGFPELAVLFELTDVFFELVLLLLAFFGAADLREGVFAPDADFFDVFFFDGLAALRGAVFLLADFFREVFLADLLADFFAERAADLRPGVFLDDFFRAAVLRPDLAFAFDFTFELLALTFRLLPVAFLPAAALRGAAFFLLVPALLRFLLAVFFAGIRTPAGSGKNAELYIAGPNREA